MKTLSFTVIRKYLTNISLTLTNRFANKNREQVLKWLVLCFFNYCIPVIFLKFSYAVSSFNISTISGVTIFSKAFKESGSVTFDKIKFLSMSVNGSPIADL